MLPNVASVVCLRFLYRSRACSEPNTVCIKRRVRRSTRARGWAGCFAKCTQHRVVLVRGGLVDVLQVATVGFDSDCFRALIDAPGSRSSSVAMTLGSSCAMSVESLVISRHHDLLLVDCHMRLEALHVNPIGIGRELGSVTFSFPAGRSGGV